MRSKSDASIKEAKKKEGAQEQAKIAKLLAEKKNKRISKERKRKAKIEKNLKEKIRYMKNVVLNKFTVGEGEKFGERVPGVFGTIVNKGNRTLKEVQVTVYFLNNKGTVIGEEDYHPVLVTKFAFGRDNKPLKPNYEKDFGYNVKGSAPSSWSGQAKAKVTDIEFVD